MYLLQLLKNCLCDFGKEDSERCFWDPAALHTPTLLPSDGTIALVWLGQGTELLSSCQACSDLVEKYERMAPGVNSAWRSERVHFSSINRRKRAWGGVVAVVAVVAVRWVKDTLGYSKFDRESRVFLR